MSIFLRTEQRLPQMVWGAGKVVRSHSTALTKTQQVVSAHRPWSGNISSCRYASGRALSALAAWMDRRQAQLKVAKTTTTPRGQVVDWVPIESQTSGEIASPPSDSKKTDTSDPKRASKRARFDIGEPGPKGHVPVLRPDLSTLSIAHVKSAKEGGRLVNIHRSTRREGRIDSAPPNPQGYFHATSSQTVQAYGCEGLLNLWNPQINTPSGNGSDHSISQTWLQNYQTTKTHSVEAGLTVDKSLNGDDSAHLFIYFTTNGYGGDGDNIGGYNQLHKGWVQTHPTIFPGTGFNGISSDGSTQHEIGIKFQLYQSNWWFGIEDADSGPSWSWLGYYPGTLFKKGLDTVAQWVSFGGEVFSALANPCSTKDQMGSGRQAASGWTHAAYQRNLRIQTNTTTTLEETVTLVNFNGVAGVDAAATTCTSNPYTIQTTMNNTGSWGSFQYFGGPTK